MSERDRFQPTREQVVLADSLSETLVSLLPLRRLHENDHETEATWSALEELGVFSITQPELEGGAGLGIVEEVLLALELGRRLVSPAVVATLAATPHLHAKPVGAEVVAAAYVRDGRTVLVEEPGAGHMLLREDTGALLAVSPKAGRRLDDGHWIAQLIDVAMPLNVLQVLSPEQMARLRLIDAAVLAGVSQTALEMAVSYAGLREQFGRPIGSFQAVKHHCADMALSARCARDIVGFAAVALDENDSEALLLIESALAVSGAAAIQNSGLNIQIHGGIGFSAEADPHLLLKRAHLYLAIAGGVDPAIDRVAVMKSGVDSVSALEKRV